jgi:hypothetical protein
MCACRTGTSLRLAAPLFFAALVSCATCNRLNAQILYGSIVGNVIDSTQAVVPAATVTITHTGLRGTVPLADHQHGDV